MDNKKENTKNKELIIQAVVGERISKEQKDFNKLILKINELEIKIENANKKNENLLKEYISKITPLQTEFYKNQFECAKIIADATEGIKFNSNQILKITDVITWLCKDTFRYLPPNEEMRSFYNYWSKNNYEEERREEGKSKMADMAEELNIKFGINIDVTDLDDSPEGYAKFQERLEEKRNLFEGENDHEHKKENVREKKQKKSEFEKLKSLRKIYIELAKLLHPDLTPDLEEKVLREEMMKQVTIAYNEKNLSELLKLELKWISKEKNNINKLSQEKLKIYISSLKDQTKELQSRLNNLSYHPRFNEIFELTKLSEKSAYSEIKKIRNMYQGKIVYTKSAIKHFSNKPTKQDILNFITDVELEIEDEFLLDQIFGK